MSQNGSNVVCVGCEGHPSGSNNPCAVCGQSELVGNAGTQPIAFNNLESWKTRALRAEVLLENRASEDSVIHYLRSVGKDFEAQHLETTVQAEASTVSSDDTLHKLLHSFAMRVAEAGIKEGSGFMQSVARDRCHQVAAGVLSDSLGKALIADIIIAVKVAGPNPD